MKNRFINLKATIVPALFILLFAIFSVRALAQNPGDPPQGDQAQANPGENLGRMLGLTPDQLDKIRAIRQQNAGEGQAIRRRVRQAQNALNAAIYMDDANETEIERLARDLAEAQAVEVRMRALMELRIRRVLTPDQLSTFRRIRQERQRAQLERRLENGNQQRPRGNQPPGNAIDQNQPDERNGVRPNANMRGDRKAPGLLGPRGRRALRRNIP